MASIAVDMALVQLRQRQAHDLAAAAANDAATAAADEAALRAGTLVIHEGEAEAVAEQIVAASELAPDVVGAPVVTIDAGRVEVAVSLEADYIFAGVVPGAADGIVVTSTASATAPEP